MLTVLFYRVKLRHRPHYAGYTACALHAKLAEDQGIYEVSLLEHTDLLPLPAAAVKEGHTHCHTCNREKGLPPAPGAALRVVSQG